MSTHGRVWMLAAVCAAAVSSTALAQDVPAPYKDVLTTLGRQGDFKDNVLKVNIPRNDLQVTVANVKTPTPFGFGGWIAMTKGTGGEEVMMGDLVLTQEQVNPVMSALLDNGLQVTALHNHFFWDEPHLFFMHVHGSGTAAELATKVKPALDLIIKAPGSTPPAAAPAAVPADLDTAKLDQIIGTKGQANGGVYQFNVKRRDPITQEGMPLTPVGPMGVAIGINFQPTGGGKAAITGDFVLSDKEVNPVIAALLENGIEVTALHSHMLDEQPRLFFMHFWANDDALKLAKGLRAALDKTASVKG